MKRFIKFRVLPMILALVMILGVATAGVSAFAAANPYDVNEDGDVTIADVTALLDLLSASGSEVVDLNHDGTMTIADVTALLDYLSGDVPEETMIDIVNAAYALEEDTAMEEEKTLTGKIVSIDTAYSTQFSNITVTIVIPGIEDKPIMCYRMKGAEAEGDTPAVDVSGLAVLDTITVTGILKNYKGTVEFDADCVCTEIVPTASNVGLALAHINFDSAYHSGDETDAPAVDDEYEDVSFTYEVVAAGGGEAPVTIEDDVLTFEDVEETVQITITVTATDGVETLSKTFTLTVSPEGQDLTMEEIVNMAYELETGHALDGTYTLTGVITGINTAYDSGYKNITVTIQVGDLDDKPIQCYRMKNGANITAGQGVEVIKVGDTITVSGTLKRYNSTTVEFDAGCTLDRIDATAAMTDEQKVEAELAALTIPLIYEEDTTVALAATGAINTDVTFSWASDSAQAVISSGRLNVTVGSENATATITVTATCGSATATKEFVIQINAHELTMEEIVNLAYEQLTANTAPAIGPYTLTGTITAVKDFSTQYNNRDVTIVVGSLTDKPILCWRLVNGENTTIDDVKALKVGDVITVTGSLKYYNGTIEFDQGDTLDSIDYIYVKPASERIEEELAALTLYEAVRDRTEVGLPDHGATYTDVAFTWATNDSTHAPITGGVLTLIPGTTDAQVTVTVTATCEDSTATKTFTVRVLAPAQGTVTDTLTYVETGMSGTTYGSWTYTAANGSGTAYAGQSAAGNNSIQMRSNNSNSGIVSTSSVGKIVSVTVTFNTNTLEGRQIWIYASDSAFTAPTELYGPTRVADITYAEGTVTYTYTFADDYAYVGIRSGSGALYLDSVEFTWDVG